MKKFFKAFAALISAAAVFAAIFIQAAAADDDFVFGSESNMTTERFDVFITVHENNVYTVKNTIEVDFNRPKHGIYLYTRYKGEAVRSVSGENGGQTEARQRYRAGIENISVTGGDCEVETSDGFKIFKIGDENETVTGRKTYTISYDYVLNDDENAAADDFYFNAIPEYWETPVKQSDITIKMPKEFDSGRAFLYLYNRSQSAFRHNETIKAGEDNFKVNGSTIKISLKNLYYGDGATVRIGLPEGYFTGERTYDGLKTLALILPILPAAVIILLFILFGRNKRVFPTVEFYPPDGMTSAEMGYAVDGVIDERDIISLIVYWADKGYISIRTHRDSDDFELEVERGLPVSANDYERTMYRGLFSGKRIVSSEDLRDSFYKTVIETTSELKISINKRKRQAFTTASKVSRVVSCLLLGVPAAVFMLIMSYVKISDTMFLAPFLAAATAALGFSASHLYQAKDGMKKVRLAVSAILTGFGFGAAAAVTVFISAAVYNMAWFALVLCALEAALALLCMKMPTRTPESLEDLGKILGLKEFIKTAELDRLRLLCDDAPEYFYHILPYAYVLGLSDKWSKRFEKLNVPPPRWYYGDYNGVFNTILFMHMFNSSMSAASAAMTSRPVNTGAGSGFGSGGFSGGIGGGFGGGGFGGGGGGSW